MARSALRSILPALASTMFALSLPNPARAQATTGAIRGQVLDAMNRPIASVEIVATTADMPRARETRSDASGQFRLPALQVGRYTVTLRHVGWRAVRHDNVAVYLDHTTTLPATVLVAGEVSLAPVVVAGERGAIDLISASSAAILQAATIRALPMERDIGSVLALLPQVTASPYGDGINMGGGTGYENAYFVDGVNVTDPMYGRAGSKVPYNFVREIEVKTGGYEAEYGRSLGGIVNVLTHSGSNDFRAEAFSFYTNNRFGGERKTSILERGVNGYSYYDAGFTLGGPIQRNRAWFFLAYNPTFTREEIRVPSFAPQLDRRTQHLFAAKVSWQPSAATTVTFNLQGDPSTHERVAPALTILGNPDSLVNLDPVLGRLRDGGTSASVSAVHVVSDALLLQATIQRARWQNQNFPATARGREGLFVNDGGTWSGSYGSVIDQTSVRTFGGLTATWTAGAHNARAGIELHDDQLDEFFAFGIPAGTGGLHFGGTDAYLQILGGTVGHVQSRTATTFVQDSWAIREGLRLNVGVRWDGQFFIDASGRTVQRLTRNWQPRVGAIFDPARTGREKFFVSAGRFYQQLGTGLASYQFAGRKDLWTSHSPGVVDTILRVDGQQILADPELTGEYYDELTLGYERLSTSGILLGIRGIRREMRAVIEDALSPSGEFIVGNPGRGMLSFFPEARRDYTALEVSASRLGRGRLEYSASYVLSRNFGNYTGVFATDFDTDAAANFGQQFDDTLQMVNATGLLPNDRTHVLKLFGAWLPISTLSLGATTVWQSGTPYSVFAPPGAAARFVVPRGTAGRTPSVFDINLRATYAPVVAAGGAPFHVILDVFHLGSRRTPIEVEQNLQDGGAPNPHFGKPRQYQSPMTVRLGMSIER